MKKVLFQFSVLLGVLVFAWFILSRINYTEKVDFQKLSKSNEEKIGKIIYEFIKKKDKEVVSDSLKSILIKIKDRICNNNQINCSEIKIHVLNNTQINAFALPDRHLVIYTGLIEYCKTPEELSGVIAHEIAHMENNHIMKRISRKIGFAILISMAGGDASNEILKEIVKSITSTAFDRSEETEADSYAVSYLAKANIDPEHFANFLFRLSQEENSILDKLEWISTHPNTKDRTTEVLKLKNREDFEIKQIIDFEKWEAIKKSI